MVHLQNSKDNYMNLIKKIYISDRNLVTLSMAPDQQHFTGSSEKEP